MNITAKYKVIEAALLEDDEENLRILIDTKSFDSNPNWGKKVVAAFNTIEEARHFVRENYKVTKECLFQEELNNSDDFCDKFFTDNKKEM